MQLICIKYGRVEIVGKYQDPLFSEERICFEIARRDISVALKFRIARLINARNLAMGSRRFHVSHNVLVEVKDSCEQNYEVPYIFAQPGNQNGPE